MWVGEPALVIIVWLLFIIHNVILMELMFCINKYIVFYCCAKKEASKMRELKCSAVYVTFFPVQDNGSTLSFPSDTGLIGWSWPQSWHHSRRHHTRPFRSSHPATYLFGQPDPLSPHTGDLVPCLFMWKPALSEWQSRAFALWL